MGNRCSRVNVSDKIVTSCVVLMLAPGSHYAWCSIFGAGGRIELWILRTLCIAWTTIYDYAARVLVRGRQISSLYEPAKNWLTENLIVPHPRCTRSA
jgi:hypothetical protein